MTAEELIDYALYEARHANVPKVAIDIVYELNNIDAFVGYLEQDLPARILTLECV
jgi:hypothetical protein